MAAFARRFRMDAYNIVSIAFEFHFRHNYTRISLSLPVAYTAMELTKGHQLRGYTALFLRDFLHSQGSFCGL